MDRRQVGVGTEAQAVWALAEALGLEREAEALLADALEEYGTEAQAVAYVGGWLLENGGAELEEAQASAEVGGASGSAGQVLEAQASAEVGTEAQAVWVGTEATRARALEGSRRCEAHWASEGDVQMLAEAEARTRRILDGTALVLDVLGALDWLA